MAPRIAFFTDSFHEVNGVALTSREFVRFAQRQKWPLFSVHAGPETRFWRDGQLETFEVANSLLTIKLERDLWFDMLFIRHRAAIRRELARFSPQVIHVTGPSHAGILGALLAYELKVPLAASWHTNLHEFAGRRLQRKLTWMDEAQASSIASWAEHQTLTLTLRFYKLARLLFAPNPELVSMLESRTGRPAYLMQRGIDTALFAPDRRTRSDKDFVIGFVGRLSPEKNVRLLAKLERALLEAGVRDCRFLIVGDGSEKGWLESNLQRAEFPGVLSGERLAEAYANMDAFVFPSETDTFGNVVLEAMASGVPVVASAGGGPKFLVRPGANGYVADSFEAFVKALSDLRTHPSLRESMSQQARQAVMTQSWDSVFEDVYSRYEELLRGKAPALRQALSRSPELSAAVAANRNPR